MSTEEQRARKREYMRRYRLENLERDRTIRKEQGQRYWRENKEKIVAKRKAKPPTDKDRARARGYAKRWREKHPQSAAAALKRYNLKNPGRNHRDKIKRLERQAGRPKPNACEICGSSKRRIAFDHCHRRGHFRGWICTGCNWVLGHVDDDADRLRKLIAYLENDRAQDPRQSRIFGAVD